MAGQIPDLEERLRSIGLGTQYSLRDPGGCETLLANAIAHTLMEQFVEGASPCGRRKASVQLLGSAKSVRAYHRMTYRKLRSEPSDNMGHMYIGSTYSNRIYPSKNAFERLRRVTVLDLYLDEAATGKYLLLRVIEPSYNSISITTIVEDHAGHVALFSAYNFVADPSVDANDLFPPGVVFVLKEPYFKIPKIGHCMLRSDCPSDVILLRPGHPLSGLAQGVAWKNSVNYAGVVDPVEAPPTPKTGGDWKKRGHRLFAEGRIYHAAECYRMALREAEAEVDEKELRIVQLSLSTAYIRLERFEAGLEYAERALKLRRKCEKGLLRAGRACYELRRYKEAKGYFEELCEADAPSRQVRAELARCQKRVLEASGQFGMYDLLLLSLANPRSKMDCADYLGPVKVVLLDGNVRAVVATADVQPGTLLVVSKALKAVWDDPLAHYMQFNTNMTIDSNRVLRLVAEVTEATAKNPSTFGRTVYGLLEPGDGPAPLFCDPETEEEPIVDVGRLQRIVRRHMFPLVPVSAGVARDKNAAAAADGADGCGLFVFPSFLNHSCLPNASRSLYNDVLVVRATRSIRAGHEVCISYVPPDLDFEARQSVCVRHGRPCHCRRCQLDRSEPASGRRSRQLLLARCAAAIHPKVLGMQRPGTDDLRELQRSVLEAEDTYANVERTEWKVDLFDLYCTLGLVHHLQGNSNDEIQTHFKALGCYGFARKQLQLLAADAKAGLHMLDAAYLNRGVLDILVNVVMAFHNSGRRPQAQKWLKVLKALERVYSGGGVDYLRLKYDCLRVVID